MKRKYKYKPNMVMAPHFTNKLTDEGLKRLGYTKAKNSLGKTVWRITPPYYIGTIQVELGNYVRTNGNCGTVSIYRKEENVPTFDKKGKKKFIKLSESTVAIAHYVDSFERLHAIVTSLTQVNL